MLEAKQGCDQRSTKLKLAGNTTPSKILGILALTTSMTSCVFNGESLESRQCEKSDNCQNGQECRSGYCQECNAVDLLDPNNTDCNRLDTCQVGASESECSDNHFCSGGYCLVCMPGDKFEECVTEDLDAGLDTNITDVLPDLPEDTDNPEDITPDTSEDTTLDSDDASEDVDQDVLPDSPEDITPDTSEDTALDPDDVSEDVDQDVLPDSLEDIALDTSEDTALDPDDVSEDVDQDVLPDSPEDITLDTSEDTGLDSADISEDVAQDTGDVELDSADATQDVINPDPRCGQACDYAPGIDDFNGLFVGCNTFAHSSFLCDSDGQNPVCERPADLSEQTFAYSDPYTLDGLSFQMLDVNNQVVPFICTNQMSLNPVNATCNLPATPADITSLYVTIHNNIADSNRFDLYFIASVNDCALLRATVNSTNGSELQIAPNTTASVPAAPARYPVGSYPVSVRVKGLSSAYSAFYTFYVTR